MMPSIQTLSQNNYERKKFANADYFNGNFVIGPNFAKETASTYHVPFLLPSARGEL